MKYQLSHKQINSIYTNTIAFMESKENLSLETAIFIGNWLGSDSSQKGKSYYDVWDLVLKNYMPSTRPVFYRSCNRRENGRIASFTSSIRCANKFSDGKGFLLICDTNETLCCLHLERQGDYSHTFFPLVELLRKEAQSPNCRFSKQLLENYIKEDEYIMRVNTDWMYSCKWYNG